MINVCEIFYYNYLTIEDESEYLIKLIPNRGQNL